MIHKLIISAALALCANYSFAQIPSTQPMVNVVAPPAPTPPVRTSPKMIPDTCQQPEYPNSALRAELQGITRVRFDVDSNGRIVGFIVVKSSGHDPLDAATLAALRTCQFTPGTYNGKPTLSSAFLEYVWKIEVVAQPASAPKQ